MVFTSFCFASSFSFLHVFLFSFSLSLFPSSFLPLLPTFRLSSFLSPSQSKTIMRPEQVRSLCGDGAVVQVWQWNPNRVKSIWRKSIRTIHMLSEFMRRVYDRSIEWCLRAWTQKQQRSEDREKQCWENILTGC